MNGGIRRPETLSCPLSPRSHTAPRQAPPTQGRFGAIQGEAVPSEGLPPRPSRGSLAPGTLRRPGRSPREGLRQGSLAAACPRLSEAGLRPWLPEPRRGIHALRRARGGGCRTQEPQEGGRKPRATGAPPKPSTPEPSKSCPWRSCGIHGPHHQLSPPAPVRSRSPPTPLPTPGLGSGFRGTGCAPKASGGRRSGAWPQLPPARASPAPRAAVTHRG